MQGVLQICTKQTLLLDFMVKIFYNTDGIECTQITRTVLETDWEKLNVSCRIDRIWYVKTEHN